MIADFDNFVNKYKAFIYSVAFQMMGDKQDAEDMLQESLIKIYKNRMNFMPNSSPFPWISAIVRNTCIDELRKRKMQIASNYNIDTLKESESVIQKSETFEIATNLKKNMEKISDESLYLMTLRNVEGLSYDEIAKIVNMPVGTVKSKVSRARKKIKFMLDNS